MKLFKKVIIILITIIGANDVVAKVRLPRLISNGMVLQRDAPLKIWGWAEAGEKVQVEFLGKKYQTKTDKQGNWKVSLPSIAAGGPYTMKVNEIEIKDILIGDVWLCSGQSNMELMVNRVLDLYENEIKQVNNTNIRYFKPSIRTESQTPQTDFKEGTWLPATQENIMNFSSLSFFYGDQLYQKHKVPIGLINNAIGGTAIESWVSEDFMNSYMDKWNKSKAKSDSIRALRPSTANPVRFNFNAELAKNDPGLGRWSKNDVNTSDWSEIALPGYWSDKGVNMRMGSMWFYKEFYVPDSLVNQKDAVLRMGRIIESDSTFVNGKFVGTISYQYPPRNYKLPEGILKPGINKLMVRVILPNGKGGFVEDKTYELRLGSQKIDLTGQWKYHIGANLKPQAAQTSGGGVGTRPSGLYNSLTSPIIGYQIKGIIWYQGESNTGMPTKEYQDLFKNLISSWRTKFNLPNMPFVFAQLANLGVPNKQPGESGIANIREAQRRTLEVANTGMAVTTDLGEWNDIHPLNKKEVARRLALEAARVAYNDKSIISSGPLFDTMEIIDNSVVINFKSVGSGLFTNNLLDGFQIAGSDGKFEWANAVVISDNKVKVWNKKVTNPTVIRYAWDDNPAFANLKNKEGLPASPFTTNK
ncbi:sialate O-acetylesterase [Flavobacterium seoulense]|uniref:Sialate O-acetylesterase n=1 Tax=Flavobacterium seoulense TaxID=1492738 RepID=A0A066WK69_9FLAO|nr:sialate O-acetylesterase [Flavobacterium seoulense]KDN54382.1 sialate O-acetylesterase [Flavobacterium seoulense]